MTRIIIYRTICRREEKDGEKVRERERETGKCAINVAILHFNLHNVVNVLSLSLSLTRQFYGPENYTVFS